MSPLFLREQNLANDPILIFRHSDTIKNLCRVQIGCSRGYCYHLGLFHPEYHGFLFSCMYYSKLL